MVQKKVNIAVSGERLKGILTIPEKALGLILFSHGSGSGRLSPRNQFVASILQQSAFATLLVDLLTEEEDQIYKNRFDIEKLTERLIGIVDWLTINSSTQHLPIGLFGATTGAAAALKCAAKQEKQIKAIVSRGGRPDLAIPDLTRVKAPTLLIVGGNDTEVIMLNNQAYLALNCTKSLEIVPRATHLFEEPGTLEKMTNLTIGWFKRFLPSYTNSNINCCIYHKGVYD
ncbi:dienelactone hydrolase family protein [Allofrancisella inopinata]|uniref:dienelactone hydrolase family protein n=1 Tax=Allofrancisella inopinata TaxID=1085647 RepID=UPI001AB02562|nr:dienelactone hydrolase family protein [Allofrancisella inopinata]